MSYEGHREARAEAILSAIEDQAARAAAFGQIRFRHDPAFRKRYGRYLRGEIDWPEVMQRETHEQWYQRAVEDGSCRE